MERFYYEVSISNLLDSEVKNYLMGCNESEVLEFMGIYFSEMTERELENPVNYHINWLSSLLPSRRVQTKPIYVFTTHGL